MAAHGWSIIGSEKERKRERKGGREREGEWERMSCGANWKSRCHGELPGVTGRSEKQLMMAHFRMPRWALYGSRHSSFTECRLSWFLRVVKFKLCSIMAWFLRGSPNVKSEDGGLSSLTWDKLFSFSEPHSYLQNANGKYLTYFTSRVAMWLTWYSAFGD